MRITTTLLTPLLIVASCTLANAASAMQCYEESRAHATEGHAYYDLELDRSTTADQQQALQAFSQAIKGKWQGRGSEMFCKGPEKSPNPVHTAYQSELRVDVPARHRLQLAYQTRYAASKQARSEVIQLLDQRANSRISKVSDSLLIVTEKYRRRNASQRANLWEILHRLQLNGDQLQIDTTRYVNGYLSSQDSASYLRSR